MTHTNTIPNSYIKRKSSTIDFGYEESEIEGLLKPIEKQLTALKKAENKIKKGESTRKVAEWLSLETDRYISNVGLWKHITKKNETIRVIVNEPTGSETKDDKNNESDI